MIEQWQPLNPLWQDTLNWQPHSNQIQQFEQLYDTILVGNRQFNLTRITEPVEFWEKHLWDSLAPIYYHKDLCKKQQLKAIDIGTGAGFPGVPVGICFSDWQVTLLDSIYKKVNFVNHLIVNLKLKNLNCIADRVEKVGQQKKQRNSYDLAFIRAVAEGSVCAEYVLPLLKIGGVALLYRGKWTDEETLKLESALHLLGGKIQDIYPFRTPITQSERHCLYLEKIKLTSLEFPRDVGIPRQKPL